MQKLGKLLFHHYYLCMCLCTVHTTGNVFTQLPQRYRKCKTLPWGSFDFLVMVMGVPLWTLYE